VIEDMRDGLKIFCMTVFLMWSMVSLLPCGIAYAGVGTSPPQTAAQSSYDAVSPWLNTNAAIQQNLANPITSNNTQMTTPDGSTSFSAQLTCPSTSRYLEVSITSIAANGELQVKVSQDTNFDGTFDHIYFPLNNISGVCANGLVSCTPGTWANCSYHLWTADNISYVTSLTPVPMTDLGGCFCINQSCGAAYTDYSSILQDIGGGIVGAIQAVDARFSISKVTVLGNTITYAGQDMSCNTNNTSPTTLQGYYNAQNGSGLTNQAVADSNTQLQDPNSAFYGVNQAFNNSGGSGVFMASCTVTRDVVVNTNSYTISGASPASAVMCVDHFLYARVYEVLNANGTADYYMDLLDTDPAGTAHVNCGAPGAGIGGWHNLDMVTLPRQASSVYFCVTASGTGCTPSPTNCVSMVNTQVPVLSCGNTGAQTPSYTYTYDLVYQQDTLVENITDTCQTLAADPSCKLQTEIVDNITVFSNFMSTGNVVPQTCKTFSGVDPHNLCRDYWLKTRQYFCYGTQNTQYDFTNMQNRSASIKDTLTQSGPVVTYTDLLQNPANGTFYNVQNSLTMPDTGTPQPCLPVCKVKVPVADTQAALAGPDTNYRLTNQSYDYYYRECANNQCPFDAAAGEILVTDCACADDFADAVSVLSSLQDASKDIICSQTGGW